ncbi:MAG: hypothetical protein HY736_12465 [Verrucomicrobia bacterium]|nr:hypothetical protein [Verrucomicrobiota bacterium]
MKMNLTGRLRSLLSLLAVLASAAVTATAADAPKINATTPVPTALDLLRLKRPLVIAHRGFSTAAPENTLPAFELALTAGADLVELDYHHSSDGQLVVCHDPTLDRTTDAVGRWGQKGVRIADRTWADLSTLDAGSWFKPHFGGIRLPRLTEALDVIQPRSVTLVERKAGDAAPCVALLRERGLINRVVVHAFDWTYLREFHRLAPEQVLGALGPPSTRGGRKLGDDEKKLSAAYLDEIQAAGVKLVGWSKMVSREVVQEAHRRGLKVWIYTIDEPAVARELLDFGVDGIITNNPALIWKTLATWRDR